MAINISVIIPAINEEESLGFVLEHIPKNLVEETIVVDGGSTDNTVTIAKEHGATVITQLKKGYGRACATGLGYAQTKCVAFLDADGADNPEDLVELIKHLEVTDADMVLGSRLAGKMGRGAMPWHQKFGNWLAALLFRRLYGLQITDLSPFRLVNRQKLIDLNMQEMTYGWPTEMIAKAANHNWKIIELPVSYRPRYGGKSKISGTLVGTYKATYYILRTIFTLRGKKG